MYIILVIAIIYISYYLILLSEIFSNIILNFELFCNILIYLLIKIRVRN